MELEGYYCDVIAKRWSEFTGKPAIRPSRRLSRMTILLDAVAPSLIP